jgi:hypothetical protein
MALFGLKKPSATQKLHGILAYLVEVERTGGLLRVEDAQGREVPAALGRITRREVALVPAAPLRLGRGDGTNLVLIVHGMRFKAPTRILDSGPGTLAVALPGAVHPAERRRMARGYLKFALLSLFSPLAAAAVPAEPSYGIVYGPEAETEGRAPRSYAMAALAPAAPTSNILVYYLRDWMQSHSPMLRDRAPWARPDAPPMPAPARLPHHRGLLAHGVTYHFATFTPPEGWRNAMILSSVRFELHLGRDQIRLGIRVR